MRRRENTMRAALAALAVLLLTAPAWGQLQQRKALVSAGGQRMTGGTTTLDGNVGDAIAGISTSTDFEIIVEHGFWAGDVHLVLDVPPRTEAAFHIGSPRPNPAVEAAAFELVLPQGARGTLAIYDLQGRRMRRVALESGAHRWTWDLRDEAGKLVPNGLYLYRAALGSFRAAGRVAVLH